MSIRSCPNHLAPFNPHREVSPPISVAALLGGRAVPNRSLKCAVLVARVAGSAPFLRALTDSAGAISGPKAVVAETQSSRGTAERIWRNGAPVVQVVGRARGREGDNCWRTLSFSQSQADHLALGQVSWVSANHLKLGGCSSDAQCLSRR